MPIRGVLRRATVLGTAYAGHAPLYVDSDDNKLKMIPAGSGTTEVEVVDASTVQTLTNKTLTAPALTAPVITGAMTVAAGATLTSPAIVTPAVTGKPTTYSTVTTYTGATDAIDISLGDIFMLSRAGAADAATLADPAVGDNGRIIRIFSGTAFAHTITITNGIGGAGGTDDVITFTNRIAASISLFAHNGKWYVVGSYLAAIA